jgi:hypothetical protein
MPKLDTATAKKVHAAEGGTNRTPVPEGNYRMALKSCVVSPRPDKNKNTYWIWTFTITEDGDFKGRELRTNTGFSDNQLWFVKGIFDAYGVKPNVDTDTLVGKEIEVYVTQHEIEAGSRKGQISNDLSSFAAVGSGSGDDDDWAAEGDDKKGEEDPDF